MKLHGILVDTATPFDHAGELYRVKIEHNIGKWSQTSVAGLVVGGFAGEGALLNAAEKSELWRIAAASAGEGKLLIAGVDAPGVREAASQIQCAAGFGFAAALVETPHAHPLMRWPAVQLLYFRAVADRAAVPIVVANRPQATGVSLTAAELAALAQHPNICGVLDHTGRVAGDVVTLCGVEAGLWTAFSQGAAGAVLPFASAAPYAAIALWEAYRTREEEAGLDWQSRIAPAAAVLHRFGPAGLKHAMDLNGYYGGPPRLPWPGLGRAEKLEIERAFTDLKS